MIEFIIGYVIVCFGVLSISLYKFGQFVEEADTYYHYLDDESDGEMDYSHKKEEEEKVDFHKTESKVDSTKVVEKSVSPTASLNDFSDYDII